jgi:hypothetical protein
MSLFCIIGFFDIRYVSLNIFENLLIAQMSTNPENEHQSWVGVPYNESLIKC